MKIVSSPYIFIKRIDCGEGHVSLSERGLNFCLKLMCTGENLDLNYDIIIRRSDCGEGHVSISERGIVLLTLSFPFADMFIRRSDCGEGHVWI